MTPEQWQKVEEVLQGALDRPPQERASFLDEACAGDERVARRSDFVDQRLRDAGDFIEEPAIAAGCARSSR